jgi:hypothetical protein
VRHDDVPGLYVAHHQTFLPLGKMKGNEQADAGIQTIPVAFVRIDLSAEFLNVLSNPELPAIGEFFRRGSTDVLPVFKQEFRPHFRVIFWQSPCKAAVRFGKGPTERNHR